MSALAVVHVDARFTIPLALAVVAGFVWYFVRLGGEDVPAARRRVRRMSLVLAIISIPNFVNGLSFADPDTDRAAYLTSWSIALVVVVGMILFALLDGLVTVRIQRRAAQDELARAGRELAEALRRQQEADGDGGS